MLCHLAVAHREADGRFCIWLMRAHGQGRQSKGRLSIPWRYSRVFSSPETPTRGSAPLLRHLRHCIRGVRHNDWRLVSHLAGPCRRIGSAGFGGGLDAGGNPRARTRRLGRDPPGLALSTRLLFRVRFQRINIPVTNVLISHPFHCKMPVTRTSENADNVNVDPGGKADMRS